MILTSIVYTEDETAHRACVVSAEKRLIAVTFTNDDVKFMTFDGNVVKTMSLCPERRGIPQENHNTLAMISDSKLCVSNAMQFVVYDVSQFPSITQSDVFTKECYEFEDMMPLCKGKTFVTLSYPSSTHAEVKVWNVDTFEVMDTFEISKDNLNLKKEYFPNLATLNDFVGCDDYKRQDPQHHR